MRMGYIFIFVGLAIAFAGGILVCCQKKPEAKAVEEQAPMNDKAVSEVSGERQSAPEEKTSKEKGNDFEGFIADVIARNGISIKEWNQGTVSPEGTMADNALSPDFFVSQPSEPVAIEYWIEAKWRSDCDGYFSINADQYGRYRAKQRESKRKVIVAVGVGGTPSQPKSVYFVPLDSMHDGRISREDMRHFYLSNPGRDFRNRMERWFKNEVFNKKRN